MRLLVIAYSWCAMVSSSISVLSAHLRASKSFFSALHNLKTIGNPFFQTKPAHLRIQFFALGFSLRKLQHPLWLNRLVPIRTSIFQKLRIVPSSSVHNVAEDHFPL